MESLEVKSNQKARTFTIRKYIDGVLFAKYRTVTMSQEEFDSCACNTENDWKQFLKSDDYYRVTRKSVTYDKSVKNALEKGWALSDGGAEIKNK